MFENLRRIFCSEHTTELKQQEAIVETKPMVALTLGDKVRFKGDIDALESEFGTLEGGKDYVLTLTKALELMPRDRKRVDAYSTLVKYLAERGITLIVESRKTKKNG